MAYPRPQRVELVPGFMVSRIPNQSVGTLVNMYAESAKGKGAFPIVGRPGLAEFADMERPDRGLYKSASGTVYGVAGSKLYRVETTDTATVLGEIPGTDRVEWAENLTQIAVCAANVVYVYNKATGYFLAEVTDASFQGASTITSVGGWGLYVVPNSDRFFATDINDFMSIQALDFATAESRTDVTVAVRSVNNVPWFLGSQSIEPWAAVPKSGFPFQRVGVNLSVGCVSRDTAVNFDNGLFWLGTSGQGQGLCVYRDNGYQAQRVSTHAVERLLERARYPERSRARTWAVDGHAFLTLTCDAGSVTYDAATDEWTQASSGAWPMATEPPPETISSSVYVGSRTIVAGEDGKLSRLSYAANTDNGTALVRELVTAPMGAVGRKIALHRLELEMETGRGGLVDAPEVLMSLSRDGGHTWEATRAASAGLEGDYTRRARWGQLGLARDFVARFRFTGDAPFNVTGAWAEYTLTDAA